MFNFQRRVLSFNLDGDDPSDDDDVGASTTSSNQKTAEPPVKIKVGCVMSLVKCDRLYNAFFQKLGKDPSIDTSFLPDREREKNENR